MCTKPRDPSQFPFLIKVLSAFITHRSIIKFCSTLTVMVFSQNKIKQALKVTFLTLLSTCLSLQEGTL